MSPDEVAVRPLTERHWPEVQEIHALGIATGNATFDDQPPPWEQFRAGKLAEHRLVAVAADGRVLGWVAASPVSGRCVYSGVVEHSVYVHTRPRPDEASDASCSTRSSPRRSPQASGRSSAGCSRRTQPVSPCITASASARSGFGAGSDT